MKRKFLNILVIIFIVFISMFTSKSVYAKEFYECRYISPMSYIDNSQYGLHPINTYATLKYNTPYYSNYFISTKFSWERNTKTLTVGAFCIVQDSGTNTIGLSLKTPVVQSSNVDKVDIDINQSVISINHGGTALLRNVDSDYVKLTSDSGGDFLKLVSATEEEYKKYVGGNQYRYYAVNPTETTLYESLYFDPLISDKYFGDYKCILKCGMNGIGTFESGNGIDQIKSYNQQIGGIIFVNTKKKTAYPTKEYNTFKSYIETAQYNGKALTSEDQQQCLDGLSVVIDTSSTDTIHYTKAFYDGTKQLWLKYIQDDLKNPKLASAQRREAFSNWFDKAVARYMFEDNISTFVNIYKYIYGTCDGTSGNTCNFDLDGDGKSGTNDDIDTYKKMISILENMHHADKTTECKLNLSNDPCESVCSASGECPNYTALEECKKGSADYAACTKCTPDCNTKCEKVGDETSKQQCKKVCYDECTNGKYSKARDSYDETIQKDKDAIAEAAKYIYGLSRVSAPSLDINFDKHYELTCDDVSFFHGFYVVIRILAPIAVVLFGTLDYAKAVLSADIDKLNKSKKSLPKRILLLILFLGVPFIVSFMVNLFGGDFSLMKCIINGE